MALRTAPTADGIIWRTPLAAAPTLSASLRDGIARQRPEMLDFTHFEPPPLRAMPLGEWHRGSQLSALLAAYSDHLYRNEPARARKTSRCSPSGRSGTSACRCRRCCWRC